MKRIILMLVATAIAATWAFALSGAWTGELAVGPNSLPLVFRFSENADGSVSCTLDSPKQGARDIQCDVLRCTADSISVVVSSLGVTYDGQISADEIKGVFRQRGYSFPLDLKPEAPLEVRRPQTPMPPFPYTTVDTVFYAPDGAEMSATLTLPPEAETAKVPAVIMVTGSGSQNRDEEIFDHRPFAVIADYLARHGIASLRYDDRGFAKSGGYKADATTLTYKDDAVSALEFVRTFPQLGKVGVLGHSEGGDIAFMIAAEGKADFIVSLAGMAVTGKELMLAQNSHGLDKAGVSGSDKENAMKLLDLLFDWIISSHRFGMSMPVDVEKLAENNGINVRYDLMQSIKATQERRIPWMDAFLDFDPSAYIEKTKCPVLAINGDKDTQVEAETNLAIIKRLAPQSEIRLMPGLNHLMQHAQTGETQEYGELTETISPEVLAIIATFITSN